MNDTNEIWKVYPQFVHSLCRHECSEVNVNIIHMVLGIIGEAGELADVVKHRVGYNQHLDTLHMREELGDLLFYLVGLCNFMGWDIHTIINENMNKLQKRYPYGYSDQDALERKDKKDGTER